ncbi:glutamine synthetase [Nitzschia inconspicua]|uniref:Glutamine synthetase n=1 Tax=Nitzschia inconspicua TaxID=303405 RepID=A0A9K3LG03_9STRA|nr:glutamine synthetase [Nitzschia inconspicua]
MSRSIHPTFTRNGSTASSDRIESAYTKALLRSLQFQGVQFLRYVTLDPYNNIRARVVPITHVLKKKNISLHNQCSIAEICLGGLASYADVMVEGTGLTARNVLAVVADPETLRVLPYNTKSAVIIGNLHDQYTDEVSPFCSRSRLEMLVRDAAEQHNVAFSVGVELEFCLVRNINGKFVDNSVYANTTTLNEQEEFLSCLYEQCQQQDLAIELIHSESAGGQIEVVLEYSRNPVHCCDAIVLTKETIQAVAHRFGMKALFLPKFDMMKAGNGMHLHMSIRDAATGEPIFCQGNGLSEQGAAFVEGILQHLPAITGLTLPTVNSHRRIGKGCWTGTVVGWAVEDKETGIRVCSNLHTKEWDHVECKLVDNLANPYLAVGALLWSGLSGIIAKYKLRPSLLTIPEEEAPPLPKTLGEALDALEADSTLTETFLGGKVSQAYLAVRRHELHRSSRMTLEEEVREALA